MRRLWRSEGARIVRGMLLYVLAMAALAALSPFDFQAVPGRTFALLWLADDAVLNLLLLFPAGFLAALAFEDGLGPRESYALALGLLFSLALESGQLYLPSRHPNLADVIGNGIGCWAGALAARRLGRWLGAFLSQDLVLELPLTGSLYLLVPLLMLQGLAAADSARAWLALPLALFGATILAALYLQRVARSGAFSPTRFAVYGASAFVVAALPTFLRHPVPIASSAACMALLTWVLAIHWIGGAPGQRRFEAATVRRAAPWFALYLIGLGASPLLGPLGAVDDGIGANRQALQLLESFAALTVAGYLLSELNSRAAWSTATAITRVMGAGLLMSLLLELTLLAPTSGQARLLRLAALAVASCAGAALHRAQVSLVRAMRQRQAQGQRTL
jgi:glycopeptide antibiotics resistance protein